MGSKADWAHTAPIISNIIRAASLKDGLPFSCLSGLIKPARKTEWVSYDSQITMNHKPNSNHFSF